MLEILRSIVNLYYNNDYVGIHGEGIHTEPEKEKERSVIIRGPGSGVNAAEKDGVEFTNGKT